MRLQTPTFSDYHNHRVDRVTGFLSSRPNRLHPAPHPQASVASPPPFGSKGGTHLLAGEGTVGANSDEGTDALVRFFPPFLSAILKSTRRKTAHSPDPTRVVSDSGTKAAHLLGSGNRGCVILSVSFRNVSAAPSLLNKVCNSIYSNSITPLRSRHFWRKKRKTILDRNKKYIFI
jgi:hypothetical protein